MKRISETKEWDWIVSLPRPTYHTQKPETNIITQHSSVPLIILHSPPACILPWSLRSPVARTRQPQAQCPFVAQPHLGHTREGDVAASSVRHGQCGRLGGLSASSAWPEFERPRHQRRRHEWLWTLIDDVSTLGPRWRNPRRRLWSKLRLMGLDLKLRQWLAWWLRIGTRLRLLVSVSCTCTGIAPILSSILLSSRILSRGESTGRIPAVVRPARGQFVFAVLGKFRHHTVAAGQWRLEDRN